jgi:5-deoxy-glucuronate isomerase
VTIHPSAPPSYLAPDELHVRPSTDRVGLSIDPSQAGWRYLAFSVVSVGAGERFDVGGTGSETVVVVVSGGAIVFTPDFGDDLRLEGRRTVFDGKPWAVYLPQGRRGHAIANPLDDGGQVVLAIAQAPSSGREGVASGPVLIRPDDVEVELRGAGNATRRIHHIVKPEFPADRLEVVEVYTPGGNWSSWPPHKHDVDNMPEEAVLEEIYYYQLRRPEGWGIQRLYRRDGDRRDAVWVVRHGELVMVTDGYHPFVTAPGYDAYYLNALAGDRRTMAGSDDPDLAWTRSTWKDLPPDPRAATIVADQ